MNKIDRFRDGLAIPFIVFALLLVGALIGAALLQQAIAPTHPVIVEVK